MVGDDPHETILTVDDAAVLERFRAAGDAIVAGVARELPGWAIRSVDRIVEAWARLDDAQARATHKAAAAVGVAVTDRVVGELRSLFALDPSEQGTTPLVVVRSAYREPTALLTDLGIPGVVRDPFDERMAPDDIYDLSPQALGDLGDPEMGPLLLAWGMTKARLLRGRAARD